MNAPEPSGFAAKPSKPSGPAVPAASEAPPVLFRMRAVGPADSPQAPESQPTTAFSAAVDDFPPPPLPATSTSDSFPPPPQMAPAPRQGATVPRHEAAAQRQELGEKTASSSRRKHTVRQENTAPAGRSWTETMGSRLVLVLLLAAVGTAFFLLGRGRDDDAVRIAEEDTNQLLADLGVGDISTGTSVTAEELADEGSPSEDIPAENAGASANDPTRFESSAAELGHPAPSVEPTFDFAAPASDSADPSSQVAETPQHDSAGFSEPSPSSEAVALDAPAPAINEPTTINEPYQTDELDLTAPHSPYDNHAAHESAADRPLSQTGASDAAAAAMTTANRQPWETTEPHNAEDVAASPRQTDMPNAVANWADYFPVPPNPAQPAAPANGFAAPPQANQFATGPGAVTAPGYPPETDPRMAQLPAGYPAPAPQPGYAQPGYGPQPSYPQPSYPQPNYAQPQGYAQQPGYAQPQGMAPQQGYAPQQGFAPQQGMAPQQGYGPQPNYEPAGAVEQPFSPYDTPQP